MLLATGRWAGWPRDRVVVVVVDADGRLDPAVPRFAAAHFAVRGRRAADARPDLQPLPAADVAAGCRVLGVRPPLPGRTHRARHRRHGRKRPAQPAVGARLGRRRRCRRALARPAHRGSGPRPAAARGRLARACPTPGSASTSRVCRTLRRLLRQRTRWAQGNLQAMAHLRCAWRAERSWLRAARPRRLPPAAGDPGRDRTGIRRQHRPGRLRRSRTSGATRAGCSSHSSSCWASAASCSAASRGALDEAASGSFARSLVVPVYAAYSWLIWPVLTRAAARQLVRRRDWAKTAREPIGKVEGSGSG